MSSARPDMYYEPKPDLILEDQLDPQKFELVKSSPSNFYCVHLFIKSIVCRNCCLGFLGRSSTFVPGDGQTGFFKTHFSIFNKFGNIDNVNDGGFGGSTAKFGGCLPPQGKQLYCRVSFVACQQDFVKSPVQNPVFPLERPFFFRPV
jgi:hypothetical protein